MQKNEKGYVMIITLLTVVLISILGIGLITVSNNSLKTTTYEKSNQSLFYLAEAGINYKEAIILDKIYTAYEEEKNNPVNKTNTSDRFNENFDYQLSTIINNEKYQILDKEFFLENENGNPIVKVEVIPDVGTLRKFTIKSEASYEDSAVTRVVQKDYEIPENLLNVIVEEVPITTEVSTPTEQPIEGKIEYFDYSKVKGQIYADYLLLSLVKKKNNNANYYVKFKDTVLNNLKILDSDNRSLFTYNANFDYPQKSYEMVYLEAPTFNKSVSNLNALNLNAQIIEMTIDLKMKKLSNFSNKVININVPSGTKYLVFDQDFLDYNLSSLRFNVTGNGTLNIIFKKYYTLNSGKKFIINAPNTKVNVVFEQGASIRGEMIVQDIYANNGTPLVLLNPAIETTLKAKLNAQNVYIKHGQFDKDFSSEVKINNLYIKDGYLDISSPSSPFYANNIYLDKHNIVINTGSKLAAKNIYVNKGDLRSHATTCVQADQITVPNGTTRFDHDANLKYFYGKDLYMIISSTINMNNCGMSPVVIDPTVVESETETVVTTKTEITYNFKEDNIINTGNIVEIR